MKKKEKKTESEHLASCWACDAERTAELTIERVCSSADASSRTTASASLISWRSCSTIDSLPARATCAALAAWTAFSAS